ncbi:MAG: hypothetical protein ABIS03_01980, partial [Gemmatimonadaceae bacterium]
EELSIKAFEWTEPIAYFELAVGFSQAGAYVSRNPGNDVRVSVREAPSVSVYANYQPNLPVIGELLGGYLGARSGIISLIGGRAFSGSETRSFAGDTFQFGPLAGIVVNLPRVNLFVEGAYMWRDFKSVEWDGDAPLGTLPRRINLTGPALSVGAQFKFRKGD